MKYMTRKQYEDNEKYKRENHKKLLSLYKSVKIDKNNPIPI